MVPIKRAVQLLLIIFVTGCNFPGATQAPAVDVISTAVAGTLAADAELAPAPTATSFETLLPHPVYYLTESSGSAQVWRLEPDGITQSQITDEPNAVDRFDVSPIDGSIAYVTDNQLYLVNADGSNRRLMVDNAAADPEAEDYFYIERINDPYFSPNGRTLAYAYNGLWVLELSTYQATQLLVNKSRETEGDGPPEAFYAPLLWAPSGDKLLITIGGSESSRASILDPKSGQFLTDFQSNDMFCCQVAWAPNSTFVLVSSPYVGLIEPGLWRYDADTGERTELVGISEDGFFQFVGWPLQLSDGSLRYFYTSSIEIPASDLPLFMMSSDADGETNRLQLRPDSFSNIGEALWAEDGSLALIVQLKPSGEAGGSVILAYSDGRQLQNLLSDARHLKWGRRTLINAD